MVLRTTIPALMLVASAQLVTADQASSLPVGPEAGDQDLSPFYRWGAVLPTKPGLELRSEALPPALWPSFAGAARRVLYTSTDGRWGSGVLPVSDALFLPKGAAPKQGWPLVVWAHGTLGIADSCAPSWTGANERDRGYVNRWLEAGFAVAAPDYQGLGGPGPHAYLNWRSEGMSVLDAARAALQTEPRIANRIVITGQSQGSGAALGAARLAARYAPELKVKGAMATALVSTFPGAPAATQSLAAAPHFALYRMVGGALPAGSPPLESLLSDKGKAMLSAVRTSCNGRAFAEANGITMGNAFAVPLARIDALLGPTGATTPFRTRFPLMLGTGLADELIPAERQGAAVRALCQAGNAIAWKRYPGAAHGATLTVSFEDALAFARTVLSGAKVASDCKEVLQ